LHSTTASQPASAALDALPLPKSLSPGKKRQNALFNSRFAAGEFQSWSACQAGQFDLEGKT
jgi:hypothetical protein